MNSNPYTNAWAPIRFIETGINEEEIHNIVNNAVSKERQFWQNKIRCVQEKSEHNFINAYAWLETLKKVIEKHKLHKEKHNIEMEQSKIYYIKAKKRGVNDPNVLFKRNVGKDLYHLKLVNRFDDVKDVRKPK